MVIIYNVFVAIAVHEQRTPAHPFIKWLTKSGTVEATAKPKLVAQFLTLFAGEYASSEGFYYVIYVFIYL